MICCKNPPPEDTDYDSESSSTSYKSDILDQTNYILSHDPILSNDEMDTDEYINYLRAFYNDFDSDIEDIIWRRYCDLWVYEGYKDVPKTPYQIAKDIFDKAKSIQMWDQAIMSTENNITPRKNKME